SGIASSVEIGQCDSQFVDATGRRGLHSTSQYIKVHKVVDGRRSRRQRDDMSGIKGIDQIQVWSRTNRLQIRVKMPAPTDHSRGNAGRCPADVNSPALIRAND